VTTSFTRTRNQIVNRVLQKVGAIGAGVSANTADNELVAEAVDLRLKEIHKLGIFWRKVTTTPTTFSLSSSVVSASAGDGDILFPLNVTFTDGSLDEPVTLIGPMEYASISDKGRIGTPEKALWRGGTEFWFYPVPGSDGTAKLLYERIIDDSTAVSAIDIDVAMIRPMMDLVKYDVAYEYGVPDNRVALWQREAVQAEKDIRKLSVQRIDYATVAVDDYDSPTNRETDYGS
jgi:hypothetical protein